MNVGTHEQNNQFGIPRDRSGLTNWEPYCNGVCLDPVFSITESFDLRQRPLYIPGLPSAAENSLTAATQSPALGLLDQLFYNVDTS
jgi:hypothetical protein